MIVTETQTTLFFLLLQTQIGSWRSRQWPSHTQESPSEWVKPPLGCEAAVVGS